MNRQAPPGPRATAVGRALDRLYQASGWAAGGFLVAIFGVVVVQVGANLADGLIKYVTGEALGLLVPSYAEFTGLFLSGASFLALAYTFGQGEHIRVSLVLQRLGGKIEGYAGLWALAAGALLAGYATFYAGAQAVEAWSFGDLSPGMVPVPLWAPQGVMTLGLGAFALALADGFVVAVINRRA